MGIRRLVFIVRLWLNQGPSKICARTRTLNRMPSRAGWHFYLCVCCKAAGRDLKMQSLHMTSKKKKKLTEELLRWVIFTNINKQNFGKAQELLTDLLGNKVCNITTEVICQQPSFFQSFSKWSHFWNHFPEFGTFNMCNKSIKTWLSVHNNNIF